jgi:hypothetical protein
MIGILIVSIAFLTCFMATCWALWAGFAASLTFGYLYGIIRANAATPVAQFVYDAGVAGMFLATAMQTFSGPQRAKLRRLLPWVICLIGWPTLLLIVPSQDFLIQLVGWRGNVLFVPFILYGALLEEADMLRLAGAVGVLNVAVLIVAVAEVIWGVPRFFPYNPVDAIIYNSTDIYFSGARHYRIPATFAHAAVYATCMVSSLPLLLGALVQHRARSFVRYGLLAASGASAIGVFLAGSRSEAIVLILMVVIVTCIGRFRRFPRSAWVLMIGGIGLLIMITPRMQRFFDLDASTLKLRVQGSVNENFINLCFEYPLGNGLGGGGTSIPYFLQDSLRNPVAIENEYARIEAEQGLPGLILWLAFIFWVLESAAPRSDPWYSGRSLARVFCAISFATAPLGTGLLNAIPQSAMILMFAGWIATATIDGRRRVVAASMRTTDAAA